MANINYDKEEPASLNIGLVIIITIVLLIGIFIATYYFFISMLSMDQNKKYDMVQTLTLDSLDKTYQKNLTELSWADQKKGLVNVPITDAMKQVVQDYNP